MSEYHFETDHVEDAPTTLGDGGDIEEVGHELITCLKYMYIKPYPLGMGVIWTKMGHKLITCLIYINTFPWGWG